MEETVIKLNNKQIERMLSKSSFSILLSLYAFHLSYSTKKSFSLEKLEEQVDFLPNKFIIACLVFSQALDLTEYTVNSSSKEHLYNVVKYDQNLAIQIKDTVYRKAQDVDDKLSNNEDQNSSRRWRIRINKLEAYFD